MTLIGLLVVLIIILLVLYVVGYPTPPLLVRAIYAVIIIHSAHCHRAAGLGTPRPLAGDAPQALTRTRTCFT